MDWIELGGEREDEGSILSRVGRFYRHFHDPLKPWDSAGLTVAGLGENESSVRWMQNRRQTLTGAAGGNWSWHDARRMYYQALTEPDPERRDALLAATFRALGQIMHLVVDASNPDHSRNDPHPLPSAPLIGRMFWNYDKAVESRHGRAGSDDEQVFVRRFLSNPIGVDRSIFGFAAPPGEPAATVPIARLIDADVYHGANPAVTFNAAAPTAPVAVGIAEVSNANFFSENTLGGQYPNPPAETGGLIRTELELPRRSPGGLNLVRRYFSRPEGQGLLPANPLFAECAGARNPRSAPAPYPCVDDVVFDQVAAHMLPRAVGYARGVLEYFFRGQIRVRQVVPRLTMMMIDIENNSDEALEGVFEVHARDGRGTSGETRRLFSLVNDGQPVTLQPGESGRFSMPITGTPAAYHVLVFRGRLGLEQEAVIGQVFAVPSLVIEPESYDADVTRTCTTWTFPPSSSVLLQDLLTCRWSAIRHRFVVGLRTNYGQSDAAIASDPVIERISAVWEGAAAGPAPLIVHGVEYSSGVWQRDAGTESEPQDFVVFDPRVRGDSRLQVTVTVRGGFTVSTLLPILRDMWQEETKLVSRPHTGFRVSARRLTVTQTNHVSTVPYDVAAVGGYPYPTSIVSDGEAIRVSHGATGNRFAEHSVPLFRQDVMTTSIDAEAIYRGIVLAVPPFPTAPGVDFSAVLTPRPISTPQQRFWNAFVAPGLPPSFSYVLRAHEAGTPEAP